MNADYVPALRFASLPVLVRQDGSGRCMAQVVGLPDIQVTAATRAEALAQVRAAAAAWLSSGELVALSMSHPAPAGRPADDPLEIEFLDDLARLRREDLERTLREYAEDEEGCSNTSSTPTT